MTATARKRSVFCGHVTSRLAAGLLASLVAAPPIFVTLAAVVGYLDGSAALVASGLPGFRAWNIDPDTRLGRRMIGGCIVDWPMELVEDVHNDTLRSLVHLFGPMRGSYVGPYPSEKERGEALLGAEPVDPAAVARGALTVAGQPVTLAPEVAAAILRAQYGSGEPPSEARCALWAGSVALLVLPADDAFFLDDAMADALVAVFEARTGRLLGYEGRYQGRRWDLPRPETAAAP